MNSYSEKDVNVKWKPISPFLYANFTKLFLTLTPDLELSIKTISKSSDNIAQINYLKL